MDVKYRPPSNHKEECAWLEENYIRCLKEKSIKDEVQNRKCVVENILWFETECPIRYSEFNQEDKLRQIFLRQKLQEQIGKKVVLQK